MKLVTKSLGRVQRQIAGLPGIRFRLVKPTANCTMPGCNPSNESGAPVDTAAQLNGAIGSLGARVPYRIPPTPGYQISGLLTRDETRGSRRRVFGVISGGENYLRLNRKC
jgi:hypothetical protein